MGRVISFDSGERLRTITTLLFEIVLHFRSVKKGLLDKGLTLPFLTCQFYLLSLTLSGNELEVLDGYKLQRTL